MASKINGVESEWARAPPANVPLGEKILKAIYNPDDKTFLGRTAKRWGVVLIFYLIFYAVLALLFAICMAGLFSVIKDDQPVYILENSLIGVNPGVSCRPQPLDGIVKYRTDNSTAYGTYVNELEQFFKPYEDVDWYTSNKGCKKEDNFGYPKTPCVFVKLNRIFGWEPEYIVDPPSEMSPNLIDAISNLTMDERKQIWVSCWDEKLNTTDIEYPWGVGLKGHFYPYSGQKVQSISPLVAVRLTPSAKMTVIRCRAWAKNIIYNKSLKEPSGYTRIILDIEDILTNSTIA